MSRALIDENGSILVDESENYIVDGSLESIWYPEDETNDLSPSEWGQGANDQAEWDEEGSGAQSWS